VVCAQPGAEAYLAGACHRTWYYAVGEENIEVTRIIPLKVQVADPAMTVIRDLGEIRAGHSFRAPGAVS
jgi:hypothetical protein